MSKKIHMPVNTADMGNIITTLNIGSTDIIGMFGANNGCDMTTILASEDQTKYEKYALLLESDDDYSILDYDGMKGYIIPGAEISMEKLKALCKEHSMKLTTVVADADFFITNLNTNSSISHCNIPKNKLMMSIQNGYAVTEFDINKHNHINTFMQDEGLGHVLWDNTVGEGLGLGLHNVETDSLPYDTYLYTGLSLQILGRIVSENIPTISATRIFDESPNQVTLTEDLLQTLLSMYNGEDDRALLTKILPTVRTDLNLHLLWELAQELSEYNMNLRDKDMNYWWNNKFCFYSLSRLSSQDFVVEHHEADTLTNEGFRYMEPKIRADIQIYNRELYTFKVEIKQEYKKYYVKH